MAELDEYDGCKIEYTDSDKLDIEVIELKLGSPQSFDKIAFYKQIGKRLRKYEKFLKREQNALRRKIRRAKIYALKNK